MILIKISADNERLLNGAKTEAELRGAVDLVLERIEQAKSVKAASKKPVSGPKAPNPYNYREIISALRDSFGDDELTFPPDPDPIWYQAVHRYAKMNGLDREGVGRLAAAIKESWLKPPYSVKWLVTNADLIMAGRYRQGAEPQKQLRYSTPRPVRAPLPSLPED